MDANQIYAPLDQQFIPVAYNRNEDKLSRVKDHLYVLVQRKHHIDSIFDNNVRAKAMVLSHEPKTQTSTLQEIEERKVKRSKGKANRLSSREKKKLGLHQLPKTGYHYADFTDMANLWRTYIKELIGPRPTPNAIEVHLTKADYSCAELLIVKSVNPLLVGKSGIVVKETQNMFCLLQPDNRLVKILKRGSVFQIDLSFLYPDQGSDSEPSIAAEPDVIRPDNTTSPDVERPSGNNSVNNGGGSAMASILSVKAGVFPSSQTPSILIYGDQLLIRPYERSKRKFKVTSTIEMGK